LTACPTRRSPSARCSPPRRRAARSARSRSLLVMVLKPSWSLYRGRARGRERVRPNERAILKHTTTPDRRPPLGARTFNSPPGVETERASYPIPKVAKGPHATPPSHCCLCDREALRAAVVAGHSRCFGRKAVVARRHQRPSASAWYRQRPEGVRFGAVASASGSRRIIPAWPGPSS
jgi:hypothetical protein